MSTHPHPHLTEPTVETGDALPEVHDATGSSTTQDADGAPVNVVVEEAPDDSKCPLCMNDFAEGDVTCVLPIPGRTCHNECLSKNFADQEEASIQDDYEGEWAGFRCPLSQEPIPSQLLVQIDAVRLGKHVRGEYQGMPERLLAFCASYDSQDCIPDGLCTTNPNYDGDAADYIDAITDILDWQSNTCNGVGTGNLEVNADEFPVEEGKEWPTVPPAYLDLIQQQYARAIVEVDAYWNEIGRAIPQRLRPTPPAAEEQEPDQSKRRRVKEDCTICFEDLAEGGDVIELSSCKHTFHRECLGKAAKAAHTDECCPLCRSPLPEDVLQNCKFLIARQQRNGRGGYVFGH